MKLKENREYVPESLTDFIIDFIGFAASVLVCMFFAGIIVGLADIITFGFLISANEESGSYAVGFISAILAPPLNNWLNKKVYERQEMK